MTKIRSMVMDIDIVMMINPRNYENLEKNSKFHSGFVISVENHEFSRDIERV